MAGEIITAFFRSIGTTPVTEEDEDDAEAGAMFVADALLNLRPPIR